MKQGLKRTAPELRPIARDLQALVRDIEAEHQARDESQTTWGPEALRRILRQDLKGDEGADRLQPRAVHPSPGARTT
jgi:trehalose 6-phosphate synthase